MPIKLTHKASDLEKRLKILESQLYGKSREQLGKTQIVSKPEIQINRKSDIPSHSESFRSDISYLKHDLTKIVLLSSLAIGIQLILYFSHIPDRIKIF